MAKWKPIYIYTMKGIYELVWHSSNIGILFNKGGVLGIQWRNDCGAVSPFERLVSLLNIKFGVGYCFIIAGLLQTKL